ncbi:tyrosine-type recombinase/integrase, partial [Escherichia coli]
RILGFLEGEHRLFAQLLYGTGMRISEGLQLRVKDLDFDHGTIIVREGKGSKDRALMWHCCKVSDEAAFCLIQRPYISKTLL